MERDYRAHQDWDDANATLTPLSRSSRFVFTIWSAFYCWLLLRVTLGVVWVSELASEITMVILGESGEDRDHRRLSWGHGMSRCGHPHAVTDPCNNSDINITSNKYIFLPDRRYHSVRSIWIAQHVWLIAPAIITWPQLAGEQLTFRN